MSNQKHSLRKVTATTTKKKTALLSGSEGEGWPPDSGDLQEIPGAQQSAGLGKEVREAAEGHAAGASATAPSGTLTKDDSPGEVLVKAQGGNQWALVSR